MSKRPINWRYYGWVVVLVTTVTHYFGYAASVSGAFSVLVLPVSKEFGWSRAQISLCLTFAKIAMVVGSPFAGYFIDRYGTRAVLMASSLCMGLLFSSLYFLQGSLWHFYAVYMLLGLLGVGTIGPTYIRLAFAWFERRKGLAIGIVASGAAIATTVNPPLLDAIIAGAGWRWAYLFLGGANLLLVLPLLGFLVRSEPSEMGLQRDGAAEPSHSDAPRRAAPEYGFTYRDSLRSPAFLRLGALFVLLGFGQGIVPHLIALLVGRGVSPATAALCMSLFGATMFAARFFTGVLLDYVRSARLGAILIAGSAVGLSALLVSGSMPAALLAAVMVGMVYGAETDLLGFLVIQHFGRPVSGRLHTLVFAMFSGSAAIGVYVMALLFDAYGDYRYPLIIAVATAAAGVLLVLSLSRTPTLPPFRPEEDGGKRMPAKFGAARSTP